MAQMDGSGPEKKGSGSGRGIGCCRNTSADDKVEKLGKGMGLRRHAGGGQGKGKRIRNGIK